MTTEVTGKSSRLVSFVDKAKLILSCPTSNVYKNAIALGDLDNDANGDIELAIGSIDGELWIFKGRSKYPWKRSASLGSITCLTIGDVRNNGKNSLVAIASEGLCYFFDIHSPPSEQSPLTVSQTTTASFASPISHASSTLSVIPVNSGPSSLSAEKLSKETDTSDTRHISEKNALKRELSSSSLVSLAVPGTNAQHCSNSSVSTLTNVSQSSFHSLSRDEKKEKESERPTDELLNKDFSKKEKLATDSVEDDKETRWHEVEVIEPSFCHRVACNANCVLVADIDEDGKAELVIGSNDRAIYSYQLVESGPNKIPCLKLKNKWQLFGQVHSLSLSCDKWGRPIILAGQNAGHYVQIDHRGQLKYRQMGKHDISQQESGCPTEVQHLRHSTTRGNQAAILQAVATLDGTLKLQDHEDRLVWELQVDAQLFRLCIVDLSGDGSEDTIFVSSWDGMTYIVDYNQNYLRYKFEDRVNTFIAGTRLHQSQTNETSGLSIFRVLSTCH
jgi:hypothetical protein